MRVDLRDLQRRKVGRTIISLEDQPIRTTITDRAGEQRDIFLNWDGAVDDAGHLRGCIVCGGRDLFREKAFPAVTAIIVVLAFIGAAISLLGLARTMIMRLALVAILIIDIGLLLFSRNRLVCYRCRTTYMNMPIARYHRGWDRATSDRPPNQAPPRANTPASPANDNPEIA